MQLSEFNTADRETAAATVAVWAAVPAWVDAVVAARPYASVGEVTARADALARRAGDGAAVMDGGPPWRVQAPASGRGDAETKRARYRQMGIGAVILPPRAK